MKQTVYIYIQQDDSVEYQTLGRLTVENGIGHWIYSTQYKSDWVPDSLHYPLGHDEFVIKTNNGIPGFILDLMPDTWGKSLLKDTSTPLDFLIHSPNADRFGNLLIGEQRRPPKNTVEKFHSMDMLPEFIQFIDQVQSHQLVDPKTISKFKTALGGARPKLTVRQDNDLFIAKPTDQKVDIACIESICLNSARQLGLNVCELFFEKIEVDDKLRSVLLLKRFDRIFNIEKQLFKRISTLSALSLLNATWLPRDAERWSYPLLAQKMFEMKMPIKDIHELYKRMIFNTAVGNDDDHPKNHAFYFIDDQWRLAPLYDVVSNTEYSPTRLAMKIGSQGEIINRENLLSMCEHFQLSNHEAQQIIDEIYSVQDDIQRQINQVIDVCKDNGNSTN